MELITLQQVDTQYTCKNSSLLLMNLLLLDITYWLIPAIRIIALFIAVGFAVLCVRAIFLYNFPRKK